MSSRGKRSAAGKYVINIILNNTVEDLQKVGSKAPISPLLTHQKRMWELLHSIYPNPCFRIDARKFAFVRKVLKDAHRAIKKRDKSAASQVASAIKKELK